MDRVKRYFGQACLYGLFILFIGFFSTSPSYTQLSEGFATVKLSVRHSGQLLGECRTLSQEELQKLPPNMRAPEVCPRERSALAFEFSVDGEKTIQRILSPAGLRNDGRSSLYERFIIAAGPHTFNVALKDHLQLDDFNYQASKSMTIKSGGVLVVNFNPEKGGFLFND